MRFSKLFAAASVLLAPGFALAQAGGINLSYLGNYSNGVVDLINTMLVPVLMAIALIVFFWGVYRYFIYGADNEEKRSEGRQFVIWSIIGFVVILSLWGLVNIVGSTLGLSPGGSSPPPPTISGSNAGTITPTYTSPTVTPTPVNTSNYGGF